VLDPAMGSTLCMIIMAAVFPVDSTLTSGAAFCYLTCVCVLVGLKLGIDKMC
jgi:hypothetical protein